MTTIDTIRYMQLRTFKTSRFCQEALKEAGVSAKSVTSIPQLVKKLGDEKAVAASKRVFEKHSRAHNTFRSIESGAVKL